MVVVVAIIQNLIMEIDMDMIVNVTDIVEEIDIHHIEKEKVVEVDHLEVIMIEKEEVADLLLQEDTQDLLQDVKIVI